MARVRLLLHVGAGSLKFTGLVLGHPAVLNAWLCWVDWPSPACRGHPARSDICRCGMSGVQSLEINHFNFERGQQVHLLLLLLWYRCRLLLLTDHWLHSCLEKVGSLGLRCWYSGGLTSSISCFTQPFLVKIRIVYFCLGTQVRRFVQSQLLFGFFAHLCLLDMLIHLNLDQVIQGSVFDWIYSLVSPWGWEPIFIGKRNVDCCSRRALAWPKHLLHFHFACRFAQIGSMTAFTLQAARAWFVTLVSWLSMCLQCALWLDSASRGQQRLLRIELTKAISGRGTGCLH